MTHLTNRTIRNWMVEYTEEHRDDCGEINATGLAEGCCCALDGYEGDELPERFFEIAGDLALADERKQTGTMPRGVSGLVNSRDASWF